MVNKTKPKQKTLVIAITGTPGTGKSTLAEYLAKKLKAERLEVHDYYKQLSVGYDKQKKCYDIDFKKFVALVKDKIKDLKLKTKNKSLTPNSERRILLIDSHITHLLPNNLVDLCIVMICPDLKKLETRLKDRKYNKQKIRENLDSEIFQICLHEAKENKHKVLVIDSSKRYNKENVVSYIKNLYKPTI